MVAIDSGMYPSISEDFRAFIEKTTETPVKKLILSHHHADHVFGNQSFNDCEIISSRAMATLMSEFATTQWTREKLEEIAEMRPDVYKKLDLASLKITVPTEVFDDSFRLVDEEFEILVKKVDGHTRGSSIIYFKAERVLFAGDLIFAKTFPWGGDPTADLDEWIAALKNILQMDIDKIVPGHGQICDLKEVQAYLDFFEPVAQTIKKLILEGQTREEVIEFDGYPEFYATETPERRRDSLAQWYQVYKKKPENQ